jgi:uncharacterized protein (TIGR02452 family)
MAVPRKRQATLDFTNGRLSAKKPLVNPQASDDPKRVPLEDIARQMMKILPGILMTRPDVQPRSQLCDSKNLRPLDSGECPGLPSADIQVVNADTLDAALDLQKNIGGSKSVCVLNMANAQSAGGGWKHGALAQEEALCYRTSLALTLKYKYYPLPEDGGIYSPRVLIIRESMQNGHALMDLTMPSKLPYISVVSVAAVCQPKLRADQNGQEQYASAADVALMETKMRVVLRIAAANGHRQIVLGAFGCGAFGNPGEEVAKMWKRVLQEREFSGGWWKDVVFAVLDNDRRGNLKVFQHHLDGVSV